MKNINIEYDMDENDLDIILKDIVKEHKKKPSLAYIFENYNQLLSVFKPNVIKRTLDSIPEDYKYAPNEGEESNTTLSMSSKTYLDKAKESIKNLDLGISLNNNDPYPFFIRSKAYLELNNKAAAHKDAMEAKRLGMTIPEDYLKQIVLI